MAVRLFCGYSRIRLVFGRPWDSQRNIDLSWCPTPVNLSMWCHTCLKIVGGRRMSLLLLLLVCFYKLASCKFVRQEARFNRFDSVRTIHLHILPSGNIPCLWPARFHYINQHFGAMATRPYSQSTGGLFMLVMPNRSPHSLCTVKMTNALATPSGSSKQRTGSDQAYDCFLLTAWVDWLISEHTWLLNRG